VAAIDWLSDALLLAGGAFFLAGTVGVVRFPDMYCRLHALAKVDNLGLGLVVLGLALRADSVTAVVKLSLIWLLALFASATVSYLIARRALRRGITPWPADRPAPPERAP
jgi:multicomponent Na+:H+ antiporter subunit G